MERKKIVPVLLSPELFYEFICALKPWQRVTKPQDNDLTLYLYTYDGLEVAIKRAPPKEVAA
jgi:hypothetical protein